MAAVLKGKEMVARLEAIGKKKFQLTQEALRWRADKICISSTEFVDFYFFVIINSLHFCLVCFFAK